MTLPQYVIDTLNTGRRYVNSLDNPRRRCTQQTIRQWTLRESQYTGLAILEETDADGSTLETWTASTAPKYERWHFATDAELAQYRTALDSQEAAQCQ